VFLKEGIKVRHIKNIPFQSFALSDKMLNSTLEIMKGGKMVTSLLNSNERLYLDHYNSIFEELWKNGIDAKDRIKDIEEGKSINVEIIPNPKESIKLLSQITKIATKEILTLLPSERGFFRTEKIGGFCQLNQLGHNGIKVKVLTPSDNTNNEKTGKIKSNYPHIDFKNLESPMQIGIGIIIVDKGKSMIFEIKDDTKENFMDSLGLAIYIEGKSTALSYDTVFRSLWKQAEMYQQLQIHDLMQKEFINIAAHELKTPLQPILGLTELVKNKTTDVEQKELLGIVISNARKLKKLSEDIMDITRIESNSLELNKENFSFNDTILEIVNDYRKNPYGKNIEFKHFFNTEEYLYADKNRISQVISNLINNSIKFTDNKANGIISITVEAKEINGDINNDKVIITSVKDMGVGIDTDVKPKLFSKFLTTSFQGMGLGLYISKNIIEAHGGKIWAKNNECGKGATFSFSLPRTQK
jgi:signal transduction histidine kinase